MKRSRYRPQSERIGQTNCFDPAAGMKPVHPASKLENDPQMQLVLASIAKRGLHGGTRFEVAKELGMLDNTVGPRLSDLRRYGLIRKTEALRDGAVVWVISSSGGKISVEQGPAFV